MTFRVVISYCTRCRWLPRAAWLAQELLGTFEQDLAEVALSPTTGGVLRIDVNRVPVWNRKTDGSAVDVNEIKRRVRDVVAPGRSLGHIDTAAN